jgi:seryl-tRNA synthetase
LERAGVAGKLGPADAMMARQVAGEAFRHGWHVGAQLHRAVAVFVLDDKSQAVQFAEFMSREVDPAHVMRSSSPLAEALAEAEHHHQIEENRRAMVLGEEVPF